MSKMHSKLIRVQICQPTAHAPMRIRICDGTNHISEAYDYQDLEAQSQRLLNRFCNQFHPHYQPGTFVYYKTQQYYTMVERS